MDTSRAICKTSLPCPSQSYGCMERWCSPDDGRDTSSSCSSRCSLWWSHWSTRRGKDLAWRAAWHIRADISSSSLGFLRSACWEPSQLSFACTDCGVCRGGVSERLGIRILSEANRTPAVARWIDHSTLSIDPVASTAPHGLPAWGPPSALGTDVNTPSPHGRATAPSLNPRRRSSDTLAGTGDLPSAFKKSTPLKKVLSLVTTCDSNEALG